MSSCSDVRTVVSHHTMQKVLPKVCMVFRHFETILPFLGKVMVDRFTCLFCSKSQSSPFAQWPQTLSVNPLRNMIEDGMDFWCNRNAKL